MKKIKKIIIAAASVAVVAGGTFGAYKLNEHRKTGKAVAEVTPVSYMTGGYYGSNLEMSGRISSGNVQNVIPDNNKLIEQVLVKVGDSVKKGDSLIKYDVTALELELKQKENAVTVAQSNLTNAERELKKLNALKPSESMPQAPEPVLPTAPEPVIPEKPVVETKDTVGNTADSFSGSGSQDDPLMFRCHYLTVVTGPFLSALKSSNSYAVFMVYDANVLQYEWRVNGMDIKNDKPVDITIGAIAAADQDGNVIIPAGNAFGIFTVPKNTDDDDDFIYTPEPEPFDYEQYLEDFYNSVPKNYPEDYTYSKAELAKMISEKETEITRLTIDKKSADLEYKIAQEQKDSGSVIARIDGVVTKINDSENQESDSPYMVISGDGGFTVTGYVGEMNLDKLTPGTSVNVMSWETGESVMAEVMEVNPVPVSYYSQNWGENPNSSTYEFTASISQLSQMPADPGVSITLPEMNENQGLIIPKVYVREENDRYYVYKAGDDDRLEKQYVNVGRTIYGSQIEILGGLTENDRITFPYGKNLKEGIKTKDSDKVLW